jgi:hypothetical protein
MSIGKKPVRWIVEVDSIFKRCKINYSFWVFINGIKYNGIIDDGV